MPEQKKAPVVRARNRGQITSTLERYSDAYRAAHPDRAVRYVYSPEHRPELSGVIGREAVGFKLVTYEELGITFEGMDPKAVVRVADLVLMSIEADKAAEQRVENRQHALEALKTTQQDFYEKTEQLGESTRSRTSGRPGIRPIGSSDLAIKTHEYEIEQRGGDG